MRQLLATYMRAMQDPDVQDLARVQTFGSIAGAGLTGSFHSWALGERERTDENLGPRTERTLRIGDRFWYGDADGDVREFTGLLGRRARTQHFIDSGTFARFPERCVLRGRTILNGKTVYALDVSAEGGEIETLYLDATTGLPDRIAYDDDDGRSTIDLSDWHTVQGHRFAFTSIASDGDHAFDTIETTVGVDPVSAFDPVVFAPLVPRRIEMSEPQTISLEWHEGHLYAPVRIGARDYTFLLDSGAQNVLVDKHVATELGLVPTGALQASGASRTGGLQLVSVPEIDVGIGKMRNVVATTIDLGATTGGAFHIDGILGYPFFAAATVRLDPARRTMTFGPPGSVASSGERISLVVDRAFPEATLRLNATTSGLFIIDTGNAADLLLYKPFVDRHAGIVPYSLNNRRSFGIGGSTPSYRSSLDSIQFGAIALYHTDTDVMQATRGAFADRFDAGNVGLGLLKNFVITFDAANAAMYLEKGINFDDGRTRV